MNDYVFTVEVSNKDGSNVRRKNIAVCADNVEVAFDKVKNNVSNTYDVIRELVGVEKLQGDKRKMTEEELEKEAVEYAEKINLQNVNISGVVRNHISQAYLAGAEPREKRIDCLTLACENYREEMEKNLADAVKLEKENAELKELIEKYRQAVDKCLHITFMGGGCEVHTIGQYATLVDGYLTDVEGLAKWKQ